MAVVSRLASSILVGTACRGEGQIAVIKAAASSIRADVFENDSVKPGSFFGLVDALGWREPELALQLSFVGRALPYGSDAVVAASLETHRAVLSERQVTPPELLRSARLWAAKWAKSKRLDLSQTRPSAVQESSCLEYSRKEGGFTRGLQDRLYRLDLAPPDALPSEVRRSDAQVASRLRASWWNPFQRGFRGDTSRAKVVPIPERGFKSRTVTRHFSGRVAYLHQFRRCLAAALSRDGRVRETVEGDHRGAIQSMVRNLRSDGVLLSADLTAASDRLPRDLLTEIVQGLLDEATLPPGVTREDFVRLTVGAYELEYPDGSKVVTEQGVLMGLPTTWPLLCLVHLYWVDLSREAPDPRGARMSDFLCRESERICGDDLSAWWRPERVALYEEIALKCGAKFSAGKHLRSRRWGIFTEEIFCVRQNAKVPQGWKPIGLARPRGKLRKRLASWQQAAIQHVERELNAHLPCRFNPTVRRTKAVSGPVLSTDFGHWAKCFPVRWAVRAPRRLPGGVNQSLPDWFTLGPATWSVASHSGAWKGVSYVRQAMFPGLGRELASMGAPPYLPRSLGGGGLTTPRGPALRVGRAASKKWRKAVGSGLYRTKTVDLPSSCWRAASSPAYEAAAKATAPLLEKPEVRVTRLCAGRPEFGFAKIGSANDFLESRTGRNVTWAAVMKGVPLKRDCPLRAQDVRDRLVRKVKELAARGGFLRPSAPVGRLLRKEHDRSIWIKDVEEEARGDRMPVNTLGGESFAALIARFGTPRS
ncbi:MAG: RNA-dependent RNA polymerase [Sanya narnavirus 10]|nr:MAG: RNA-dependent RNA polymerase [Sanya narnavirus 10]